MFHLDLNSSPRQVVVEELARLDTEPELRHLRLRDQYLLRNQIKTGTDISGEDGHGPPLVQLVLDDGVQ